MERLLALIAAVAGMPAAQVAPAPAATHEAVATPDAADELIFTEDQSRMTVPVEIAGAGPYRFLIDTGAQRSVVTHQLARRLGLPAGRRVRLTDMAGSDDVGTVVVPSIAVGRLGGTGIEAIALDAVDVGAAGMLGIDTLQGHAVTIDFDRDGMSVRPSRRRSVSEGRHGDDIVIRAKSLFGQLVVTDAEVSGRKVRVVLDTGTAMSIGNLALLRLVSRGGAANAPIEFTSVMGNPVIAQGHVLRELKLASTRIGNLEVAFADAPPFRAFGLEDRPALLLGMNALRLFRRVDIDFANKQLRLTLPRDVAMASP